MDNKQKLLNDMNFQTLFMNISEQKQETEKSILSTINYINNYIDNEFNRNVQPVTELIYSISGNRETILKSKIGLNRSDIETYKMLVNRQNDVRQKRLKEISSNYKNIFFVYKSLSKSYRISKIVFDEI